MKAFLRQREIYHALGNSAAALSATWEGYIFGIEFVSKQEHRIANLREEFDSHSYANTRHPNPTQVDTIQITNTSLQVRGAWKKLRVEGSNSSPLPPSRTGHAGFVWKGDSCSLEAKNQRC